jgi:phosphoribosylamine--glycine ligase
MLSSSLLELMLPVARGERLPATRVGWRTGAALTTVLAARGYPDAPESGKRISIPAELPSDVLVFHAGTKLVDDDVVTSGGRVLAVTGLGKDVAEAGTRSREVAEQIQFDGKYFRRDIGWRELERGARLNA